MKRHIILSLLMMLSVSVYALEIPHGSSYDKRIQYVNYNSSDVVVINSLPGRGTRIVFSPDENILDIASGFTRGWELKYRRNILFLKPKSMPGENGQPPMLPKPGTWNTNLMVTTNLRLYDFDLRLASESNSLNRKGRNAISYRVEFRYPKEQAEKDAKILAKQTALKKLENDNEPRNTNYTMQIGEESQAIAPTAAYDDGRFTYLTFPNNREFSSIFHVADDKEESIVNYHIDPKNPDVMVIHRVAREFALRLGNAVVGIYNESYDPDGIPAKEGTTVPGVKRVIKGEEISNE